MNLSGKVALVTGGAHRVGGALSRALANAGAAVVVNYHASAEDALQLREELHAEGARVSVFQADVSRKTDVDALVNFAEKEFGRLDVVINNASLFESAPLLDITEAMWDRVLAVNLKGPFLVSQAAAPLLKAARGNIVNIADLSAFQPWPSFAHHSVSKAGLIQLTKVLARTLAPEVRVNAIAPGTVLPPEGYDDTSERRLVERTGDPDDVVRALFYLLESNFVTGQVVVVDGGRMLL